MVRILAHFLGVYGKRVIAGLVLAALVIAFSYSLPYDLAFWLGGETLFYIDVVAGVAAAAIMVRAGPAVVQLKANAIQLLKRAGRQARRVAIAKKIMTPTDEGHRAWLPDRSLVAQFAG